MTQNEWQDISTAPEDGTVVVYFCAGLGWDEGLGPTRDYIERCELGWFADGRWWEAGTGHDMFESWRVESGGAPTHWMELPKPPESKP